VSGVQGRQVPGEDLMKPILTAEEFLTLMLAKIRLKSPSAQEPLLPLHLLDQKFETAYESLIADGGSDVQPNFSFRRHHIYGNSVKFRDALLAVRERRLVRPDQSNNGFKVSLSKERARELIDHGVIDESFLDRLAEDFVQDAATPDL
jgi:hypothetical protein